MKLEISLFKFDCKSDYLPYYKKYFLKIKEEKTLFDIFKSIYKEDEFSYEENLNFGIVVNGLYTDLSLSINDIKNDFGLDLIIEPLSIKRAYDDLLINTDDFEKKLEVLNFIIDEYDKKEYFSYKNLYYASNTLNHENDYFGDAVLLLANSLIIKHHASKEKILEALSSQESGIKFHTSLSNRIYKYNANYETIIEDLKKELKVCQKIKDQNFRVNNTYIIDFGHFENDSEIKHDFKDFNLAYYSGKTSCEKTIGLLNNLNAKILNLHSMKNDLAMETFHINQDFTYKLAAHMLLEAFDNSADLLIVDNDEVFYLLDYNRRELQRISGREILLPIIHVNELEKLASGDHVSVKQSLERHLVNPDII
ncbi:MAG: DUF5644 domain-containing protein [Campylobacteraceae bacterium]|nr:DUF5644 domain-containing protein [Campylobacteraceae bacterium]